MIVTSTITLCPWAAGIGGSLARGAVWASGALSQIGKHQQVWLLPVRAGAFAVKLSAAVFMASSRASSNMALDLAPFGRWTLRERTAQRRSALRWATRETIWEI
jgi:hypothetical protein